MLERNHLISEISSLRLRQEHEFETAVKPVVSRIAWAKSLLNKITGSRLKEDSTVDESYRAAIEKYQAMQGLEKTRKVDYKTERALLESGALLKLSTWDLANKFILHQAKTKIEDWTHKAIISEHKKGEITNGLRDPRKIKALVLHHMAYKAKDKNGQYSNPERYLTVGAHFNILLDGRIMQHHPVSRLIFHSQCTSRESVGVEFEGNFPDSKGRWWYPTDKKTGKKIKINEDVPTQAQYESGRFLLNYLKLTLGIKDVLAHRQSAASRANDPGPDIWFNVGEWGLANLGLSDGGKNYKCGNGQSIPPEWRNWKRP